VIKLHLARIIFLAFLWSLSAAVFGNEIQGPFDELADPDEDYAAALAQAESQGKLVMLIFGANWCGDCRAFESQINQGELKSLIDNRFVKARINVGQWDINLDFVKKFGNPIAKGIPSIVIVDTKKKELFITQAGELANARNMSSESMYNWFEKMASNIN
jgi:protein disulfide-isomerase